MKYHQKKTLVLNILDKLPSKLGYYFYHLIQRRTFKSIDSIITANTRSVKKVEHILTKFNISLKNQTVVEIGSGWLPIMPFLFKKHLNVTKIITYDINKHYTNKNILSTKEFFKDVNFKFRNSSDLNLPDFIDYFPKTNIINAQIENDIRLIFSRFVLEHVKPIDIQKMHEKFYTELDEKVKILHLISPSDHRAYSNKTLSYYDFLKYSQIEWDKIQTKFDYHNRLRLPHYIKIFKDIGFKITHLEYDTTNTDTDKYLKYKQLNIHSDYQKFNEKEILAGSICILLEK
ncbi:MAG: hypothetical protein P8L21_01820 [Polaribacter sp.]|nr:hypothetical protein [Polaribacter sp.]MDG2357002.1 hypothetical protein [Polaribacter sp.]